MAKSDKLTDENTETRRFYLTVDVTRVVDDEAYENPGWAWRDVEDGLGSVDAGNAVSDVLRDYYGLAVPFDEENTPYGLGTVQFAVYERVEDLLRWNKSKTHKLVRRAGK